VLKVGSIVVKACDTNCVRENGYCWVTVLQVFFLFTLHLKLLPKRNHIFNESFWWSW